MGVEAFGISLKFVETGIYECVKRTLEDYPGMSLQTGEMTPDYKSITGEYGDGSHFIESQLTNQNRRNECTLAVRFSLCSYQSIDEIFIQIIKDFLSSNDAEAWLMTSALKQKDHYPPGESTWLISALPDEIRAMREHWQSLFGGKQGAVRVKDSFSFVGLRTS